MLQSEQQFLNGNDSDANSGSGVSPKQLHKVIPKGVSRDQIFEPAISVETNNLVLQNNETTTEPESTDDLDANNNNNNNNNNNSNIADSNPAENQLSGSEGLTEANSFTSDDEDDHQTEKEEVDFQNHQQTNLHDVVVVVSGKQCTVKKQLVSGPSNTNNYEESEGTSDRNSPSVSDAVSLNDDTTVSELSSAEVCEEKDGDREGINELACINYSQQLMQYAQQKISQECTDKSTMASLTKVS